MTATLQTYGWDPSLSSSMANVRAPRSPSTILSMLIAAEIYLKDIVHVATGPHSLTRLGLCALTQPKNLSDQALWSQTCYRYHTRYQGWPYDFRLISQCAPVHICSLQKLVAVIGRHELSIGVHLPNCTLPLRRERIDGRMLERSEIP